MFAAFPPGRYRTILADPPWKFETYSDKGKGRSAERHYDCLSLENIKALPVCDVAADDCALFMWATFPHLPQALEVIAAWGFAYKSGAVWVKQTLDGNGWRMGCRTGGVANPELLLLATRGEIGPRKRGAGGIALIEAPRREHSRKPDETYERIERMVGPPYIELFARRKRPGWSCWGNEVRQAVSFHNGTRLGASTT